MPCIFVPSEWHCHLLFERLAGGIPSTTTSSSPTVRLCKSLRCFACSGGLGSKAYVRIRFDRDRWRRCHFRHCPCIVFKCFKAGTCVCEYCIQNSKGRTICSALFAAPRRSAASISQEGLRKVCRTFLRCLWLDRGRQSRYEAQVVA